MMPPNNQQAEPVVQPEKEKVEIRGVFSAQEIRKVGTGTTTRKSVHKSFWFVEQHGSEIHCQPLNMNYVPSGPKRKISMDELLAKFAPEPEFYMDSVFPKMQELNATISRGDAHREKGESFAAEFEYDNALKVDEENIRANFGIGLTYLERGDREKAQNIFERLVRLEGTFEEEHKHLFNSFGINLRKNKMLDQSVTYYKRAIEITAKDENLYINLARAQLELKDMDECITNLQKALELSPGNELALKFLVWLRTNNLVPEGRKQDVAAMLAPPARPEAQPAAETPSAAQPAADTQTES